MRSAMNNAVPDGRHVQAAEMLLQEREHDIECNCGSIRLPSIELTALELLVSNLHLDARSVADPFDQAGGELLGLAPCDIIDREFQ